MERDPKSASDALHERSVAFVSAFTTGLPMPESFDALACDIARFQARTIDGFARLCLASGVSPDTFRLAKDVPAVPTEVFKASRVATFPVEEAKVNFHTSGTTLGVRGTHAMRRPETYDTAALAFGRWALTSDLRDRPVVLVLGPGPDEAPDSSLARMTALFADGLGAVDSRRPYFVNDGILQLAGIDERIAEATVRGQSVLLLATSFALVHLLDALEGAPFRLPQGSRVMHTGGFKGRSREIDGKALRRELSEIFAVDERAIVGEYGMTELSSQFYEATLLGGEPNVYVEPPWARIVPVHPDTLEPVDDGQSGIARILDLMNVDSAVAVLSLDRVRRRGEGVELLGRMPGAPPRGCSLALDELMGAARSPNEP
jgi:hypothetical protein